MKYSNITRIRQQLPVLIVGVVLGIVLLSVLCLPRLYSWMTAASNTQSYLYNNRCLHYTPSYPSAGGPGCSSKCKQVVGGKKNTSYGAGFYNTTHQWPEDLVHNMLLASKILKSYGKPHSLDTERGIYIHVTFDYYCCYSPDDAIKIGKFLNSQQWTPHEVQFDRVACVIYSTDMVALVLMVDEKYQNPLFQWALQTEKDLEAVTGVQKHIPHHHLFHMTIATVNQSVFPVKAALEEVNRVIQPGTWHSSPIALHRPICNTCNKLINDHTY